MSKKVERLEDLTDPFHLPMVWAKVKEDTGDTVGLFVETDARTPHQNQWVQICLEIAQGNKNPSLARYFWVTMANRMKNAQQFSFGTVEDVRLKKEAVRAGPLIAQELLSLPYPSVIYNYSMIPDPADVGPEIVEAGPLKFSTIAAIVDKGKMKDPLPGPLIFAADFMFAKDPKRQFPKSTRKYLMIVVGGVAFQSHEEEGRWEGEVMHASDMGLKSTVACIAEGVGALSMILSTRGIPLEVHEPKESQQKSRIKKGKTILPTVTHVDTQRYYAAMMNTEKGHHASPVPHLRRGHIRRLASGKNTWVKDTIVNCRTLSDISERDHYEVE